MDDDLLLAWSPTDPAEARALVQAVHHKANSLGVPMADAPAEPDNCCDRGCIECVWLGHYAELMFWRDAAVAAWR